MVPPAWLSQQSADAVECRRQMSGAGSQQGTSALFHKDSGKPERTAGMRLAPELSTNGVQVCLYSALYVLPHSQSAQTWITQCYLRLHQSLPLSRKRSPDGAFPD